MTRAAMHLALFSALMTSPLAAADLAGEIFAELGLETIGCPDALAAGARCASGSIGRKQLRRRFDTFAERRLEREHGAVSGWRAETGYHWARLLTAEGPFELRHYATQKLLALVPGHPCFPTAQLEKLDVRIAGQGASRPEQLERVIAEFPAEARVRRIPASVIVDALVLADGSVQDMCVISSSRSGLGFEGSALRWLSRLRLAPATDDGEPVNVIFSNELRFEFQ